MSSNEIVSERKIIEEHFKKNVNITTGQLVASAKMEYEEKMKELQKKCPHIWDSGEYAIQKLNKGSICVICRKKFDAD